LSILAHLQQLVQDSGFNFASSVDRFWTDFLAFANSHTREKKMTSLGSELSDVNVQVLIYLSDTLQQRFATARVCNMSLRPTVVETQLFARQALDGSASTFEVLKVVEVVKESESRGNVRDQTKFAKDSRRIGQKIPWFIAFHM
jgi:hypothetical protein